ARGRAGKYGGSLENRTRFMRQVIEGIHAEASGLKIVVRLSAFDTVPFRQRPDGVGEPEVTTKASMDAFKDQAGFCIVDEDGAMDAAVEDARGVLRMLERLGVRCVCVSGGSPYYNPHVQRPAMFPPLDGYEPPEDPLRGVARQIAATSLLKNSFPNLVF